jgi:hypothetical protein
MHLPKTNLLSILVLTATLLSCQNEDLQIKPELNNTPYFDLKGLINRQVALLDSLQPEVTIAASIGERTDTQTLKKDSADWAESLKLYADADLNKPVLRDQYLVSDSNLVQKELQVRTYRAKDQQEVDIPFMQVIYKDSITQVREVEAVFREDNPLYTTLRQMKLYFEADGSHPRLIGYTTSGKQKMILRDSVTYQTEARIKY